MSRLYGFDTDDWDHATAALLVYAVYRSRNRGRLKVTPDLWGRIERFTKSAAKRSRTMPEFIERLKPRLACETLSPRAMAVGLSGELMLKGWTFEGEDTETKEQRPREFLTEVLKHADERRVIDALYRETAWIILLVRDRLEAEKPIEANFETALDMIDADVIEVSP